MREPPLDFPDYRSTALWHPKQPLVHLPEQLSEMTGPALGQLRPGALENDLTRQHDGERVGERITVSGRLLDTDGRPIRDSLVEIWQANASGRYAHRWDRWPAPLDPNFSGGGRTVTDADGRYEFVTIKPGPYPWGNHPNAWRPAHIHFSLLGRSFEQRLVTQMYFPGDPLFPYDPIFNSVRDPQLRERLISGLVLDGAGDPIPDALVETWQHDPPAFARCPTDDQGGWYVLVPRARFVAVHVLARGLLRHLSTRVYLEPAPDDPVLVRVPAHRRDTLMAQASDDGYRFDIRIQGDRETVFFDL